MRGKKREITPDLLSKIKLAYLGGRTIESVASELGIPETTLRKIGEEYNLRPMTRRERSQIPLLPEEYQEAMQLFKEGKSIKQVAESLDRPESSFRRKLDVHPEMKALALKNAGAHPQYHHLELEKVEKLAEVNVPIDIIARAIERSRDWLVRRLESDDNNEIQMAYTRGRERAMSLTHDVYRKEIEDVNAGVKKLDKIALDAMKQWDTMKGIGMPQASKTYQQPESDRQGAVSEKGHEQAQKLRALSERQVELIMAGKLSRDEMMAKSVEEILLHAKAIERSGL
jgi:hypothetical protein